jgi:hypothetical protein
MGNSPARVPGNARGKRRSRIADTPSPSAKAKKRRRSPVAVDSNIEAMPSSRMIIGDEERWVEYDDGAWVAAANSIAAELARTNEIMEKGIEAAEGTREAIDRMTRSVEEFVETQRDFQGRLLEGLKNGFRADTSDKTPERESDLDLGVDIPGEAASSSGSIEV